MMETTSSLPEEQPKKRRRVPRDPAARFKPDEAQALAAAETLVPEGHLSRRVLEVLEELDTSEVESEYSALGRHGYPPRRLLALWVYASLIGVHHATKLARLLVTDAALRLLSGGHVISRPVLNRFRMDNEPLFAFALEQTVKWAFNQKLVEAQQLAVDSVRLRAHASTRQVRTLKRSTQRLKELTQVDTSKLAPQELALHEKRVRKHTEAVERCTEAKTPTVVLTSPAAGLMQFPKTLPLPGHRVTVTASGVKSRMVVGVLINAAANDNGLLEGAVREARRVLVQAGLPEAECLQAAGDAGYWTEEDLGFAAANADWVDVLLNERAESGPLRGKGKNYFGRTAFTVVSRDEVLCPAGTRMAGPYRNKAKDADMYQGVGCTRCPLRPACTPKKRRSLTVKWEYDKLRARMRERMAQPGAQERYRQRMATVEPVFSSLEDCMGFRRVSSRKSQTVTAEILLKLLAHNVGRLLSRCSLLCVYFLLPLTPAPSGTHHPPAQF